VWFPTNTDLASHPRQRVGSHYATGQEPPARAAANSRLGMPGRRSVDRNIHLSEAARGRRVFCGHDTRAVRLKGWPLLKPDDDDRNGPAGHILLIPHVLVGGQEDLKASVLGHGQQLTVLQRVPRLLRGRARGVADQELRIGTGVG
jgi:hypothetical protein